MSILGKVEQSSKDKCDVISHLLQIIFFYCGIYKHLSVSGQFFIRNYP